jgi:hypothetical protein
MISSAQRPGSKSNEYGCAGSAITVLSIGRVMLPIAFLCALRCIQQLKQGMRQLRWRALEVKKCQVKHWLIGYRWIIYKLRRRFCRRGVPRLLAAAPRLLARSPGF